MVCAEALGNTAICCGPGMDDDGVVGLGAGIAVTPGLLHDVLFAPDHWPSPFAIPTRRDRVISLSSRSAVTTSRSSRGEGLAPRNFRVARGPHWDSPDVVSGAQPGSTVLSNRSPSVKCS